MFKKTSRSPGARYHCAADVLARMRPEQTFSLRY
jgi:hypothetical protein